MKDNNEKWEILKHAGMQNESTINEKNTYEEAKSYVKDNFTKEEMVTLRIDITRNGSTEY